MLEWIFYFLFIFFFYPEGANATLRVTVTGGVSAVVTEVFLVVLLTSERVNGSVEALGKGKFLARFDNIPSGEFVVLVKGQSSSSRALTSFQRQTSNTFRASAVTVSAVRKISRAKNWTAVRMCHLLLNVSSFCLFFKDDLEGILEPGVPLSVPFSVLNHGSGGNATIQATNDQGFPLSFPPTLLLSTGIRANGTVNITAPASTASGTDVTLTIEANAPGDTNYVVLRLTVLVPVTSQNPSTLRPCFNYLNCWCKITRLHLLVSFSLRRWLISPSRGVSCSSCSPTALRTAARRCGSCRWRWPMGGTGRASTPSASEEATGPWTPACSLVMQRWCPTMRLAVRLMWR